MAKVPERVVQRTTAPPRSVEPVEPVVEEHPTPPVVSVAELAAAQGSPSVTVTQLSELDSYILQRQREQPRTLEGVEQRVEVLERKARERHRLTLPDFFEALSYDHGGDTHGPYVFRWLFKDKRAIDRALNVIGWTLVNQTYFPGAPRHLFTANGGIEVGDSILAFMPARQALAIRVEPAKKSQERLASRVTQVEQDYVLMTGNPKDERVYKPELGAEAAEEAVAPAGGELVEGRDF